MCPRHHLSFCACTTAWLAPEILVSMCSSPYLWFLHAKQWLLEQNYKSLWVPDLICGLWRQNSDFWTRITNLYGSQTSPVVLCMHYSVISTRNTCLNVFQPLSLVFACKTATFGAELQVSMGPSPHVWFLDAKQQFWTGLTSLYGSQT